MPHRRRLVGTAARPVLLQRASRDRHGDPLSTGSPTWRDGLPASDYDGDTFRLDPVTPQEASRDRHARASQDVPAVHRRRVRRRRRRPRPPRSINPANDQVIANVPASSAEDVDRAVERRRRRRSRAGSKTTPQDRSLLLLKIADALEAKADELGRLESAERRQAGRRRDRRDGRLRRPLPLLRRRGAGHGRPRRQRVRGRPHLDHPARPDRRRRLDRAVELPALHGDLEARSGAGDRQHGRPQAVGRGRR